MLLDNLAQNLTSVSMRLTRPSGAILSAALILLTACYAATVAAMVEIWSTQAVYSYGFLVPVISGYICWIKWQECPGLGAAPDYRFGVPLALVGMAMLLVGRAGAIISLQFASMVVSLAAFVLLVFGRETFRRYSFPIAYLLLMVPIWNVFIDRLQDPSRIVSAGIARQVLGSIGVPVFRQGTFIVLPSHTLSVMRECSGVNQLVAMVAMVLPAAYLWLTGRFRRLAIVILAVLITYLSNGFRIALVGWLAFKGYGNGNLLGSYAHVSEGLVVALLGYVAVGGCFSLMSRWERSRTEQPNAGVVRAPGLPVSPRRRVGLDVAILAVLLMAAGSRLLAVAHDVPLTRRLAQLPATVGDWTVAASAAAVGSRLTGVPVELVDAYPNPTGELRFENVDDELVRTYQNAEGDQLQLYVGYYRRQEEGKELTGGASDALRLAGSTLALASGLPSVGEVVREDDGVKRGLLFWYDVNGRVVPQIYLAKAYTIWNSLSHGRSDGAIVMIGWQGSPGASGDSARQQALEFGTELQPLLQQFFPR